MKKRFEQWQDDAVGGEPEPQPRKRVSPKAVKRTRPVEDEDEDEYEDEDEDEVEVEGEDEEFYRSRCPQCGETFNDGRPMCKQCGKLTIPDDGGRLEKSLHTLDAMGTFLRSVPPELDDEEINAEVMTDSPDDEAVVFYGRSALADQSSPDAEGDDGLAVAEALIDGHNYQVTLSRAIGREVRKLRRDVGYLAKALLDIGCVLKAMRDQTNAYIGGPQAWDSGRRSGRKSIQSVPEPSGPGAGQLKGEDLVAKATLAGMTLDERGQPLLAAVDVAAVHQWAAAGGDMNQISEQDPELAARLARAIRVLAQQQGH
jgi:hypothetical protein